MALFRTVLLSIGLSLSFFSFSQPKYMNWEVGFQQLKNDSPKEWYKATVPGAVQLDYAKAKQWGDYTYDDNYKDYKWMEDVYWTYRTSFKKEDLPNGERHYFVSKGIDYQFEIILNGEKIMEQEGMFKAVDLDLTDYIKNENELKVLIYPVPKVPGKPDDRQQAAQSVKPAVSYSWDWHPRLIPSGIWDETFIESRKEAHFSDVFINYKLSDDFKLATISLNLAGNSLQNKSYQWILTDPNGEKIIEENGRISDLANKEFKVKNPQLWWTHDHGNPNLYTSELKLVDNTGNILDTNKQKIGFRRIRLVMHEGAWSNPDTFPKSRSNPPITLELNGRRIFGKGSNWVNPEIFPGKITKERYNTLLDQALDINFNVFRIWGGGIVNKEIFYELCDEKGIMVWTEFPLACNDYEGTPRYLAVLEQEAEAIIKRIRKHPSNAIWSGGNELFNAWSGMTDQSLAIRLLNSLCYKLDPTTPFIPTSPLMGMSHGHYVFKDPQNGEEVYAWMQRTQATAYTEFGMPGAASVDLLKKIIPEEDLFPPKPGTSWETHHAFNAWVGDTWLMKDILESYFGEAKDLETLVEQSQWLQGEGYKAIFEEARRQKPVCAMALNWCYNEPWITAANNSLISYPTLPKPAFYEVKNACRPFMASGKFDKFSWKEGETFTCEVFLLNDLYENIPSGQVNMKLKAGEKELVLLQWNFDAPSPNTNLKGPIGRIVLPNWNTNNFEVLIEVEGKPEYSSSYTLKYQSVTKKTENSGAARQLNH